MTMKKVDISNNKVVELNTPKIGYVDEFYSRIGSEFSMNFNTNTSGELVAVFDSDDLPEGISENEVKQVLADMRKDGWI